MSQDAIDLKYFLSPRSIAIIGASNKFDSISGKPVRYLREQQFEGKVFPINPKYDELKGYKCYKSVLDVPEPIDLALVAVNYKLVLPMLEQCVEKGIKFASIFASGFAESGEEGKLLQKKIADLAKKSGMRISGPNCQGSLGLKEKAIGGFSASMGVKPLVSGPIGYVTQSGALGYSIFSLAQESGVGFSYVANTGNEVDLHTLDFMEFMLEDKDTKMAIAYLEGIKNGRQFIRLANRASGAQQADRRPEGGEIRSRSKSGLIPHRLPDRFRRGGRRLFQTKGRYPSQRHRRHDRHRRPYAAHTRAAKGQGAGHYHDLRRRRHPGGRHRV